MNVWLGKGSDEVDREPAAPGWGSSRRPRSSLIVHDADIGFFIFSPHVKLTEAYLPVHRVLDPPHLNLSVSHISTGKKNLLKEAFRFRYQQLLLVNADFCLGEAFGSVRRGSLAQVLRAPNFPSSLN